MKTSSFLIWAFDPTQNPTEVKNIVQEVRTWSKQLNCSIQPVAVISKSLWNFPIDMGFPWKEDFEKSIMKLSKKYLNQIPLNATLPPKLIYEPSVSKLKMAYALSNYAKRKKALIIFAQTRTKKENSIFRIGSFTEALLSVSKTPVLLMNPKTIPSTKISNVLYPTDFSKKSKKRLIKLGTLAKTLSSKLIIYNQIETPNIYPVDIYDTRSYINLNMKSLAVDIEKSRKKTAEQWIKKMEKMNIKGSAIIENQHKDLATDITDTAAKKKIDLIALSSHESNITQAFLGSIRRDILTQAKCPILFQPK